LTLTDATVTAAAFIDPNFSQNYIGATNAGVIRGAYHFAHPDTSSGATQANFLLAHGGQQTTAPLYVAAITHTGSQVDGLATASHSLQPSTSKVPVILDAFARCPCIF